MDVGIFTNGTNVGACSPKVSYNGFAMDSAVMGGVSYKSCQGRMSG
jgi:hypothetical protein